MHLLFYFIYLVLHDIDFEVWISLNHILSSKNRELDLSCVIPRRKAKRKWLHHIDLLISRCNTSIRWWRCSVVSCRKKMPDMNLRCNEATEKYMKTPIYLVLVLLPRLHIRFYTDNRYIPQICRKLYNNIYYAVYEMYTIVKFQKQIEQTLPLACGAELSRLN